MAAADPSSSSSSTGGTRMRLGDRHKVCFPIDGRPAIVRALDVYREAGSSTPSSSGAMADQVMETVSANTRARSATRPSSWAPATPRASAPERWRPGPRRGGAPRRRRPADRADASSASSTSFTGTIATWPLWSAPGPRSSRDAWCSTRGRRGGERRDARRADARDWPPRAGPRGPAPTRAEAREILLDHLEEQRAAVAYGDLWEMVAGDGPEPTAADYDRWIPEGATRFSFPRPGGAPLVMTPDEVGEAERVNVSVYLAKASALTYALEHLRDNAQHRYLLTSSTSPPRAPGPMAAPTPSGRCTSRTPPRPGVQQPGDPRGRGLLPPTWAGRPRAAGAGVRSTPSGWGARWGLGQRRALGRVDRPWEGGASLRERAPSGAPRHAAACWARTRPCSGARRAGEHPRRHIDHQGGNCNPMAIDREILMAVHPRDDDHFRLHNVEDASRRGVCQRLLLRLPWDNWLSGEQRPTHRDVARRRGLSVYVHRRPPAADQVRRPGAGAWTWWSGTSPSARGSSSSALVAALRPR